ncbi:MAG TPA: NAD(P)/FAD-dependent oxidoreductase [Chloroflexota bacterium]|nr:NAD(P)/FAD-dependent oxidoreductase [Chloroflexota bacterium]
MRVGILGGGAMGLTAAYRLASAGHQVVVIEKMELVGGLAAGFRVPGAGCPLAGGAGRGDAWLERFYHHLFRSDRAIQELIEEIGLGDRLLWVKPKTSVLWRGRLHQLDDPLSVLRFQPLPLLDRLRLGAAMAYLKLQRDHRVFERTTALAWIRRYMGRRVAELLWEPLLRSKFHDDYDRVSMAWFWSRVFCRSGQLGYVRGGFQPVYERLAELVRARGGQVRLGEEVRSVAARPDDGVEVVTDRGVERFDQVLSTLPTRLFARIAQGLPESWLVRHDWGDWLGAHCVILALDRPLAGDVYWVNVNDPGYPFLALVDHANFMAASDYGGLHPVYLGNYLPMSSPRFTQTDGEILSDFLPHLKRINPGFDESWVKASWVFKAPYAQPVVTLDYPRHIPEHVTPLPNVYMANMFQVYPQDRGQNYSVKMANEVAQLMLRSVPTARPLAAAT